MFKRKIVTATVCSKKRACFAPTRLKRALDETA
jgi:hypothetical protein